MWKLFRFFKPYIFVLCVMIGLLFVQALTNLALPDYMSRIINYGIQQGGITAPVPRVIRAGEYEKLLPLLPEDGRKAVSRVYVPYKTGLLLPEVNKLMSTAYSGFEGTPVYVLNTTDEKVIDSLVPYMAKPLIQTAGEADRESALSGTGGFSAAALDAMPDSIASQAAVSIIAAQYRDLGIDTQKLQLRYMFSTGMLMLLITFACVVATVLASLVASRTAAGISRSIRKDVFEKVEHFSSEEFDRFSTASLITRTTNDIQQIQMFLMMLFRNMLYAPIIGIGGVIKVFGTSASMAWITGVGVAGIIIFVVILFSVTVPKFLSIQKMVDNLNLIMRENLSGMMVIRAFNTQTYEEKRFDKANIDYTRVNRFVNRILASMMPLMMLIVNAVSILIFWFGSHQINDGFMQVGNMMAFMQYAMQIFIAFFIISAVSIVIPRASASARRVNEVLDTAIEIRDPDETVCAVRPGTDQSSGEKEKGTVEFIDVGFKYAEAENCVLRNISFTALPGQTTAIIGSTGSGKSTLVQLLPRLYDATEGTIRLDGTDIRCMNLKVLRDKTAFGPQIALLFSGTIESNLKYGNQGASPDELEAGARIAQAFDFIMEKPEQFTAPIAQGGSNVDGGQKQRLAIARAIMKDAEVFVFDDSFSALDFKTDAELRKALKSEMSGRTVIIVAQRISTIMHAEQIVVLDRGVIAGLGTHAELMRTCDVYREIAESQLSEEELESFAAGRKGPDHGSNGTADVPEDTQS